MKEKIFNIIIILISLFVLIQLFISKNIVYSSVIYALRIWVNTLIPALFPFFIIFSQLRVLRTRKHRCNSPAL